MHLPTTLVCCIVGILLVSFFPSLDFSLLWPSLLFVVVAFCAIFLSYDNLVSRKLFQLYRFQKQPLSILAKVFRYLCVFLFGVLWGIFSGKQLVNQQLDARLEGKEIVVEGIVSELPESTQRFQRFKFTTLNDASHQNIPVPKNILLSWYASPNVSVGEHWQLRVKLKRPRGSVNQGGFDYQRWLLSQGVGATGYVRKSNTNKKINSTSEFAVEQLRENIRTWLLSDPSIGKGSDQEKNQNYNQNNGMNFLLALAIGDNDFLTQEQWQLLRSTGTNHLMAISGLHIGLIASFGFLLGTFIRRVTSFVSSISRFSYITPAILSVIFAFFYASLAGFSVSTQRALVMVIVVNVTLSMHRRLGASLPFLWAMLFVVLLDPLAIYDMGFWLSFSAVASLLWAFSYRTAIMQNSTNGLLSKAQSTKQWFFQLSRSQWVVFLGLLLPLLLLNQSASFISPFANFFAIPWVSFTVVLPLLLSMVIYLFSLLLNELGELIRLIPTEVVTLCVQKLEILSRSILRFSHHNMEWCADALSYLSLGDVYESNIVGNHFSGGFLKSISIVLAFIGIVIFLSPLNISNRLLLIPIVSALLIAPMFLANKEHRFFSFLNGNTLLPASSILSVTVLDVGQGLAVVVKTKHSTLLYDTGPGNTEGFNAGQAIIYPFLRHHGINHLDTLIVSHNDNDHVGGLAGLLNTQYFSVGEFIVGEMASLNSLPKNLSQFIQQSSVCDKNKKWKHDGVTFQLLEPNGFNKKEDKNNQSCVLLISFNDQHILIPGDIERRIEQQLLRDGQLPQPIQLIIAPHHGSRTSSSASFVNYLQPQHAIFSAGYNSRYGHPHPKVVARYQRINTQLFNTGLMGQTIFRFADDGEVSVEQWRQDHRRYWYSDE